MEEPVFIKCGPAWPEETEEPSNFEENAVRPSDNPVKIKEEPHEAIADPSLEGADLDKPSVNVKNEIFEEEILHELVRNFKEEPNSEDFALSTEVPVDSSDGSCQTLNSRTHIACQFPTPTEEVTNPSSVCHQTFSQDQCAKAEVLTPSVRRMCYVCKICSISFSEKSLIKEHVLIHSTPYYCNVCKKSFSRKSKFEYHIITHSAEKSFSCNVCNRKFKRKGALKIHSSIHTGVLPYSCDVCNRKFRRSDAFKIHSLTHTGVLPYSCDVCHKKFHIRTRLSEHIKIHSGERHHFCSICKKGFMRKSHVQQHMVVHSEKNVVRL